MSNPLKVNLQSLNQQMTFAAKGMSKHWHMIDTKEEIGGNAAAPTPMEMVLEALGGCTGMDAIAILKKKRTPFSQLDIELTGERADEHPKIFTDINIKFILHTDGGEKALGDLQTAVKLSSEKYCSVAAMLRGIVNITHESGIIEI
ncbi:MAG: OsmC family protein [Candidatus Marinimicrobia bacterium]|nr:OsmC family protein [Candidatus Neomarinimicrobiota bacterium]